ncbi:MAG: tetratricopeptide repeat protein [Bacteroidota bacterium]
MTRVYFILIVVLLLMFQACSILQPHAGLIEEAETAYESGRKEEAFALYRETIDTMEEQDKDVPGEVYNRAGLLAFSMGETALSIDYLESARHTEAVTAETFYTLAKAYREIDNLSLEISNLERYVERYPDAEAFDEMQLRLFETMVESRNWQQADELWPSLSEKRFQDEDLLTDYMIVKQKLGDEEHVTDIAEKLLALNENNIEALEWLAKEHFHVAQRRYQREMDAYEENRTHQQYARLLEAWDVIHTDFRIALNYFERLYKLNPDPDYIQYLVNLHERLNNDDEAHYYRQKLNE